MPNVGLFDISLMATGDWLNNPQPHMAQLYSRYKNGLDSVSSV